MVTALSFAVIILTTVAGILAAMIFQHRATKHKLRTQIFSLRAAIYLERGTAVMEGAVRPKAWAPAPTRRPRR